jgi:hypothetical protein
LCHINCAVRKPAAADLATRVSITAPFGLHSTTCGPQGARTDYAFNLVYKRDCLQHLAVSALRLHSQCRKDTALSCGPTQGSGFFVKTAAYISAQCAPEAISRRYFVLLVNIGNLKRYCQGSTMHPMMRHTTYTTLHCGMLWCQGVLCT